MRKQWLLVLIGTIIWWLFVSMIWSASSLGVRQDSVVDRLSRMIPHRSQSIGTGVEQNPYSRFDEIYKILKEHYYTTGNIDTGVMLQNAIKAYVEWLGDYPYTIYMDKAQTTGIMQDLKGSQDFEGIGAVIAKVTEWVIIEQVIKDSPAYKSGLMPLDLIIQIGQTGSRDLTVFDAVQLIRWPQWTTVDLTIVRTDKKTTKQELIKKTITREKLSVPSVRSSMLTWTNQQRIGYIVISSIGEETENMVKTMIRDLEQQQPQGIILDLRGNGWWFLPISVQIASHFIPKGTIIATSKFTSMLWEEYTSFWYGPFDTIPIVVLIDWMTASAWEIIALALQQQRNALLIGTQSFGKWSIQTIKYFDDGNSLKMTVGRRYAPDGTTINHVWIKPDIEVAIDREEFIKSGKDIQLEKAIAELSKKI